MTFIVFKDGRGQWRWHLRSKNSRLIACSGEGYKNKAHCLRMVRKLQKGLALCEITLP